jgi:hypothetical protein
VGRWGHRQAGASDERGANILVVERDALGWKPMDIYYYLAIMQRPYWLNYPRLRHFTADAVEKLGKRFSRIQDHKEDQEAITQISKNLFSILDTIGFIR